MDKPTKLPPQTDNPACPMHCYHIYGLGLQSTRPLTGLFPGNSTLTPDLRINWLDGETDSPHAGFDWTQIVTPELQRRPRITFAQARQPSGCFLRVHYARRGGWIEFVLDPSLQQLWLHWSKPVPMTDLQAFLIGTVLGCVLRLRGVICLHASVVALDGRAIALLGPKRAGKSTTAAALVQAGGAFLSDDMAVLKFEGQQVHTAPGFPGMRLWPAAIDQLYGAIEPLPLVYSDRNKRYLYLSGSDNVTATVCSKPMPLAAIYVLDGRSRQRTHTNIETLLPPTRFLALATNTSADYALINDQMRAQEFSALSQLSLQVPIRRPIYPVGLDALPQLCDAIFEDVAVKAC